MPILTTHFDTLDRASAARRFLAVFFLATLLGIAAVAAGLAALGRFGLLPSPPLTGTACINDKFAFLRDAPLGDRTLVAVGSSATWRNLDVSVLERRLPPGTRAINAAPCYLHMDQTAYLAEFLLARMPRVDTVLVVLHPRDFETCPPAETAFFEPRMAGAYLSGAVPAWLPYVTGFRPLWTLREAARIWRNRERWPLRFAEDAHGSSVLRRTNDVFFPGPRLDPRCTEALARLEAAAAAAGARLVLATLPVMPAWAASFDPDGAFVEGWTGAIASSLRRRDSVLIDGRGLAWDDSRFADPVHLLYPNHTPFTEFLADALTARRPARLAGG